MELRQVRITATPTAIPAITATGTLMIIPTIIRTIIRAATLAQSQFAPTATMPTIPIPARLMGITGLATLSMASLLEQVPGITATTAAGITAAAGMATAQDTAGIIATAMTTGMGTEATGGDTVGGTIATGVVGMIVAIPADT